MIRALTLTLTLGLALPATAQTLKTFTNGEVADAGAVNDNFTAVRAAADAADAKAIGADAKADAAKGTAEAVRTDLTALTASTANLRTYVEVGNGGQVGIGFFDRALTTTNFPLEVSRFGVPPTILSSGYGSGSSGSGGRFLGQGNSGAPRSPAATTTGSSLATFGASGYTGTAFTAERASMAMRATQAWTDAANGAEIVFSTTADGAAAPTERVVITRDGRVVVGTSNPGGGLEVTNANSSQITTTAYNFGEPRFRGRAAGGSPTAPRAVSGSRILASVVGAGHNGFGFADAARIDLLSTQAFGSAANGASIAFSTTPNGGQDPLGRMTINENGRVGIGTTNPTRAMVEIDGYVNTNPGAYGLLYLSGATGNNAGSTWSLSLYANTSIAAAAMLAFSDARIKRTEGRSDAARDLTTLLGIEVTDYTYIDTPAKGTGKQKKVVAQQVEQVFPQAVSRNTDVVPDIYQQASVVDGWVQLATDLQKGERVRLIGAKAEGIHEVLEVREGAFRTDFAAGGDVVFVYGREVDDFRSVDYDAIAMLNVSATQELARRLVARDAQVAALEAQVAALEAADEAREARLSRLEAALEDQRPLSARR